MSKPLSFQDVLMRLDRYWADHGCLIWQPYSEKLGAGTGNPATTLRVLGPDDMQFRETRLLARAEIDDLRPLDQPARFQRDRSSAVRLLVSRCCAT